MTRKPSVGEHRAGRRALGLWLGLALILMSDRWPARDAGAGIGGGVSLLAQDRPAAGIGAIHVPPSTVAILQLRDGPELTGRLVRVSADALVVDLRSGERRTVPAGMVTAVWTRGDRLTNGALIGGAVGLAGGLLGQSGCTDCGRERAIGVLVGVPLWAGVGAWLDARHAGRTLVYRAPEP